MNTESKEEKNSNNEGILDFDNFLPKFLIKDLDSLKLDEVEEKTSNISTGSKLKGFRDVIEMKNVSYGSYGSSGNSGNGFNGMSSWNEVKLNGGQMGNMKEEDNEQILFNPKRNKYWSSENVKMSRLNGIYGEMNGMGMSNFAIGRNNFNNINNYNGYSDNHMGNNNMGGIHVNSGFSGPNMNFSNYPMYNSNNNNNNGYQNFQNPNFQNNYNQVQFQQQFPLQNYYSHQQYQQQSSFTEPHFYKTPNNQNKMNSNLFDVSLTNPHKRTLSSQNVISNFKDKLGSPCRSSPKSNNLNLSGFGKQNSTNKSKTSKFCKEEFETFEDLISKLNNHQLELVPYICTQKGSRSLQHIAEHSSPEKFEILLELLRTSFTQLMMDVYGNYLCQKLIQNCSSKQRVFILQNISHEFCEIACNSSGTHSLQALIEIINLKDEEELIKSSVEGNAIRLALDANGTHIVQKILSCIDEANRPLINKAIIQSFYKLVLDSNGICVLKKFVKNNEDLQLRTAFLEQIQNHALEVIQNPFGNYIVQYILDEWGIEYCKSVFNIVLQNFLSLSMQKFSSNVVEKCIDFSGEETKQFLIKEIFHNMKLTSLVKNKYGNFVLQKVVSILSESEKKEIKSNLVKKVNVTSNKEKTRINSLLNLF